MERSIYLAKGTESELGKPHQVYSYLLGMPWTTPGYTYHLPLLTYHNLLLTEHFMQVVFDLAEHFSISL